MSSQTYRTTGAELVYTQLLAGALAGGIIAGIVMGLLMGNSIRFNGAFYGIPDFLFSWIAHLVHSLIFAIIFAVIVAIVWDETYRISRIIGLGALYGLFLELVATGLILPLLFDSLPIPFWTPMGFVTHLVYGLLLGAILGIGINR